jgi:hypothetical protein
MTLWGLYQNLGLKEIWKVQPLQLFHPEGQGPLCSSSHLQMLELILDKLQKDNISFSNDP